MAPVSFEPTFPLVDAVAALVGARGGPPGACLAVSQAGEIDSAAAGVAQAFSDCGPAADPAPLDLDTATDLGSVTKIVATTAALSALVAHGAARLGDRLDTHLPWVAGTPAAEASVGQLLEHRAGLWEWWPLYLEHAGDPPAALRAAAALPLRYRPGDARHYSDLGFMLLGEVVAAAAGEDLASAVSQLVLQPAGLTHTRYVTPAPATAVAASSTGDRIERRMVDSGVPYPVTGQSSAFAGWREHVLVGEVNDGNAFHALASCSGHAGLFSTARDLLRFGDDLLARLRGDHGAAASDAWSRFFTPSADLSQGLGLRCWSLRTGPAWGHTGFPGVGLAVIPHLAASVVLVTNRLHVTGEPVATEPMWLTALGAAELHCTTGLEGSRWR